MRVLGAVVVMALASCADRQVDPPGSPDGVAGTTGGEGAGGSGANGAGGGSGGSATRPRLVQSGSRLRAVVYRGADGSQHPTGAWFDTQLGVECTFRTASDGQIRCVPSALPFEPTLFQTAQCAGPVALLLTACGGAEFDFFSLPQEGVCSPAPRLYRKGAAYQKVDTPPDLLYRNSPAGCAERPLQPGEVAYALGDELAPTDLVAATVEHLEP